ncbi:MAG: tetratricopeptide repeat protein [Spirochaetes bacterium]|nr:tetratricopeptide repeat protein [Spirochaetota bacterium]
MILLVPALLAGCTVDQFLDYFMPKSVRRVTTGEQTEDLKELMQKAKGFEDQIEEKIEAGDRLANVYEALAAVYLVRKNWQLSIQFFEKTIALGNGEHEVHRRLGVAYANRARELGQQNDYDKALYHYNLAIEKKPDNYDALYGSALILFFEKNEHEKAFDRIQTIVEKKPDYYEARFAYGRMLYESGNRNSALTVYQSLVESLQSDPESRKQYESDAMVNVSRITRELAAGVDDD